MVTCSIYQRKQQGLNVKSYTKGVLYVGRWNQVMSNGESLMQKWVSNITLLTG